MISASTTDTFSIYSQSKDLTSLSAVLWIITASLTSKTRISSMPLFTVHYKARSGGVRAHVDLIFTWYECCGVPGCSLVPKQM